MGYHGNERHEKPVVCILDDNKDCDNCCDCFICDLNPEKLCNNCAQCLKIADYNGIEISEIIYDGSDTKRTKDSNKNTNIEDIEGDE